MLLMTAVWQREVWPAVYEKRGRAKIRDDNKEGKEGLTVELQML